jgi:hypothetical protein
MRILAQISNQKIDVGKKPRRAIVDPETETTTKAG